MSNLRANRLQRQRLETLKQTATILIVSMLAGIYLCGALLMLQGVI